MHRLLHSDLYQQGQVCKLSLSQPHLGSRNLRGDSWSPALAFSELLQDWTRPTQPNTKSPHVQVNFYLQLGKLMKLLLPFSLPFPYGPQVPQSHTDQPFTARLPAPALNPNAVDSHLPEARGATPTREPGWFKDQGTAATTPPRMCGTTGSRRVPRLPRGSHPAGTTFPIRPLEPVSGRRRRLLVEVLGVVSLGTMLIFKIRVHMSFSFKKTSELLNPGNSKSAVY